MMELKLICKIFIHPLKTPYMAQRLYRFRVLFYLLLFPNIVHHPERSKAVNQLFWHRFSEGNLAELEMGVMCLACKSARTPQMFEVRTDVLYL